VTRSGQRRRHRERQDFHPARRVAALLPFKFNSAGTVISGVHLRHQASRIETGALGRAEDQRHSLVGMSPSKSIDMAGQSFRDIVSL
jgi:hypothetical protein